MNEKDAARERQLQYLEQRAKVTKGMKYTGIAGSDTGGKQVDTYRDKKGQEWHHNPATNEMLKEQDSLPRLKDPLYEVRGQRGYKKGGLVKRGYGKARK